MIMLTNYLNNMKKFLLFIFTLMSTISTSAQSYDSDSLIIRIAEIEVYQNYLTEYLSAATEIGGISVREEPGVICIYPMQLKEVSTKIRILEIYRSQKDYQNHLNTAHFLKYKKGTLHMVKSLKLQPMHPLDPEAMPYIFKKTEK